MTLPRRKLDACALQAIVRAQAKADMNAAREKRQRRWLYVVAGMLAAMVAAELLFFLVQA